MSEQRAVDDGAVGGVRPRFSVVTITRNDRAGLESTWRSLRAQTLEDFEWIVVDGASTDGTVAWLESIEDARLDWSSEADGGIYDAMNKGLARSVGDLVVFMNGADEFASAEVLGLVDTDQRAHEWEWAYGAARLVDAQGEVVGMSFQAPFSFGNLRFGLQVIPHQAAYFTRSLLDRIGPYDPSFGLAGDQEFMLRAAQLVPPHVIGVVLAQCLTGGASYGGRPDRFVHETATMRRRHSLLVGGNRAADAVVTGLLSVERRARHLASRLARKP